MREITEDQMSQHRDVEINKYIRLCPTCYFFSEDGTCDMCDACGTHGTNNHGLKPSEIQRCETFRVPTECEVLKAQHYKELYSSKRKKRK